MISIAPFDGRSLDAGDVASSYAVLVEPGRRQAPAYEAVERIEPYHSQHLDLTQRSVSSGPFVLKLSDGRPAGRPTESLGRPALHVLFLN